MTKIFINPGHSLGCKPDAGCCYNGIKEATICAELAEKVAALLDSKGFDIQLYQQQGAKLTSNQQLNNVPKTANASKADLFVSIHMNGFTNPDAKGTETWYSRGSVIGENAATAVHKEMTKAFNSYTFKDRGCKIDERGLCVLKSTIMPAILIEVGFISNVDEANFIKTHLNEIAQRIANGICIYYGKGTVEQQEAYPSSIRLTHTVNDKYNCYVDDKLKLANNKLSTCLDWVKKTYA